MFVGMSANSLSNNHNLPLLTAGRPKTPWGHSISKNHFDYNFPGCKFQSTRPYSSTTLSQLSALADRSVTGVCRFWCPFYITHVTRTSDKPVRPGGSNFRSNLPERTGLNFLEICPATFWCNKSLSWHFPVISRRPISQQQVAKLTNHHPPAGRRWRKDNFDRSRGRKQPNRQ